MTNALLTSARSKAEEAERSYTELIDRVEKRVDEGDLSAIDTFASELDAAERNFKSAKALLSKATDIEEARSATSALIPRGDSLTIREPDLYREDGPNSYFSDLYLSERKQGQASRSAAARLEKHAEHRVRSMNAEQRAAWADASFYPPEWVESAWVQARRQRRVAAQLFQQAPLPPFGNTLEVPSYAGAAPSVAADVMSADNAAVVSNSPGAATVLTTPVTIYAGYLDIPRRLLERSLPGIDTVIFNDIANDINKHVDYYTLYGNGSNLQPTGVFNASPLSVSFTDTLNVTNFYAHLWDAIQQIQTNAFESPDAIIAHPRRIGWLMSQVDADGRPLMVPNQSGPYNALGVLAGAGMGQDDPTEVAVRPAGWIGAIPVYADANITTTGGSGTNQDELLVGAFKNAILWEDKQGIREFTFEGVASDHLNLRLQAALYASFLVRFPDAFAVISGSSLTPPTF